MDDVQDYAEGCVEEAKEDIIPLWGIEKYFRDNLGIKSPDEVKTKSLLVSQKLIENQVMPGNMVNGGAFNFWPGLPQDLLARISAEWPENGVFKTLGGCWFALKK